MIKKLSLFILFSFITVGAWAVPPRSRSAEGACLGYHAAAEPQPQGLRIKGNVQDASRKVVGKRMVIQKVPVILVNYANMSFRTSRHQADSLFQVVSNYFADQSMGLYRPQFDIYGPVTVSEDYAYYGANRSGVNTDLRPGYLVTEACALMDDSLDFSQYDLDNNGEVDLVYVLYAGPPASDGDFISSAWISDTKNLIWPHYWVLSSAGYGTNTNVFDGKTVNAYEVSSELDGAYSDAKTTVMAGIGIVAHEFGHALGLPDFYPTTSATHKTLGMWSIMDYGCYGGDTYTPVGYTAYERWFMGWLTPEQLTEPANGVLKPLNTDNKAYLIADEGKVHNLDGINPSPTSFYLLENRQQTGWDASLPGHGMLIYKVQYSSSKWQNNTVNNVATSMGIDIIEADNQQPTRWATDGVGKQGDCFPYDNTNAYTPYTYAPITEITETDGVITFLFRGGAMELKTEEQKANNKSAALKVMTDGILYIQRGDKRYTILGQ